MKRSLTLLLLTLLACPVVAQLNYVWKKKKAPNIASGIYEPASFTIQGKIYVAGGCTNNLDSTRKTLWMYNASANSWSQLADMPGDGAYGCRAFVINNQGYVFTGWWRLNGNILPVNVNFKYNPVSNAWSTVAPFPDANRYTGVAFAVGGKGYYGTGYSPLTNDFWKYSAGTNAWNQVASLPAPARQAAVGCALNGMGYMGLGGIYNSLTNDWWAYNPATNSWTQKASFPGQARSVPATFTINQELYVVGGSDYNNLPFQDVYKYNPVSDTWTYIGLFPGGPRFGMAMGQANGKGYVGQGSKTTQSTFQYITENDWWQLSVVKTIADETGAGSKVENETENFRMYPNPAIDFITVDFPDMDKKINLVAIYDLQGKMVLSSSTFTSGDKINVETLSPGVYMVKLDLGDEVYTQKLIVSEKAY